MSSREHERRREAERARAREHAERAERAERVDRSERERVKPAKARENEYFVPKNGIDREVITADICRYLGNDALVRPGTVQVRWQMNVSVLQITDSRGSSLLTLLTGHRDSLDDSRLLHHCIPKSNNSNVFLSTNGRVFQLTWRL